MIFDNKFGMFVHWGIYAQSHIQDQVFVRMDWPREKYEALKNVFNPVDYDPEKWVLLAKEAGMKYICFTTKHHDGFCMWDTKYTDYNIMHTPYGKDVLKMLSEACHKHGMLLSLYYSNPDWHHPYAYNKDSTHQWRSIDFNNEHFDLYKEYMKNQITELLTNYGPIYTLFWDIPPRHQDDSSLNDYVRTLQPNILINDRGFAKADFSTPEREYHAISEKRFSRMTEACNSLGQQSWGYREKEDFYSARFIKSAIDRYMAMGGSYLLNVGPDEKGVVTEAYTSRLKEVGKWYNQVSEALEGTDGCEFEYEGRNCSFLTTQKGSTHYLHFVQPPISSAVSLKTYPGLPKKVTLLNTGKELFFEETVLPEFFDIDTGKATQVLLHITGLPIDELDEPVVLKLEY